MGLSQAGDELGAETVVAATLVQHDQAAGTGERGGDGVELERREAAQVEEVEAVLVLLGEEVADFAGNVHHFAVGDKGCEITLPQLAGLPDLAVVRVPRDRLAAAAVQGLVLEEDDGIVVLVGRQHRVERILGRARVERLEAGEGEEQRFQLLRMERAEGEAAAAGEAEHERTRGAGAEVEGRGVEAELGDGLGGEVGELEFLDGPVTVDGEADRVAGAGALGERGVEHAAAAELLEEAVRDLEGAAVRADVLAEDDGFGAFGEDLAQRGVAGLGEVERGRGRGLGLPRQGSGGRGVDVGLHARRRGPGHR